MKIIAAPDSFKKSISPSRVSMIIADEILKYDRRIEVIARPMADGGENTAEALLNARQGIVWVWLMQRIAKKLDF